MVKQSKVGSTKEKLSKIGLNRLTREIFRQAAYDWGKPEYQDDVIAFLESPWAEDLADLYGMNPRNALMRLKAGEVSPQAFHADYCPGNVSPLPIYEVANLVNE